MKNEKTTRWLPSDNESGQSIVLIAFMMIVLLGFTALAIDGGRLYFLRRDEQNAVDAAVVAAVFELCANSSTADVIQAAEDAALDNGFDASKVTVVTPYNSDPNWVSVTIDDEIDATFAQLIYGDKLPASVKAVGSCDPPSSWSSIGSVFAGATGCPNANQAMSIQGAAAKPGQFLGAGIHSNSGENNSNISVPGGTTTVDPPNPPGTTATPIPMIWPIEKFRPNGEWAQIANDAGNYYVINGDLTDFRPYIDPVATAANGGKETLYPGIYYVTGDIKPTGQGTLKGRDASQVTMVAEGVISLQPDSDTVLHEYEQLELPPMPLMAAYNNGVIPGYGVCNVSDGISLSGSVTFFHGVIFAPYGEIQFSSSNGGAAYGALVGWQINLSFSDWTLYYDPTLFPPHYGSGFVVE